MTISEKTRIARVGRWTALKNAWEAKLKKAENQNDTDVANKMIAEADMMLSRLEEKGEDVVYAIPPPAKSAKKSKKDTDKYQPKINESTDDKNTIGL